MRVHDYLARTHFDYKASMLLVTILIFIEKHKGFMYAYVTWDAASEVIALPVFRTMRSTIELMKKVARILMNHRVLLIYWFQAKGSISAGTVEGMNTEVKITTRKAYGFLIKKAIQLAWHQNLGALPEPEHAHRFC